MGNLKRGAGNTEERSSSTQRKKRGRQPCHSGKRPNRAGAESTGERLRKTRNMGLEKEWKREMTMDCGRVIASLKEG